MLDSGAVSWGFMRDLALVLIGAAVGEARGMWKDWKRERQKKVTDVAAATTKVVREETQRAQLQQQVTDIVARLAQVDLKLEGLEGDIDGVAAGMRTRFKVLEAVFVERTGQMPKVVLRDSGEQDAVDITAEYRKRPRERREKTNA